MTATTIASPKNYVSHHKILWLMFFVMIITSFAPSARKAVESTTGITLSSTQVKDLEPEFIEKVKAIAARLQTRPEYLLAVMKFESGFSASKRNLVGSGATGLIQFMPFVARRLGTTTNQLARMNRVEQLDYVEKYLAPYTGRMNTLTDTYMAVLYPVAVGKGEEFRLFRRGTIEYRQNSGLDINRDGFVTAGEAASKVRSHL